MMRKLFDQELKTLNDKLFSMGALVEKSIEKAINALINSNVEEAKKAIEEDDKIDQAKKDIESLCMKLLLTSPTSLWQVTCVIYHQHLKWLQTLKESATMRQIFQR